MDISRNPAGKPARPLGAVVGLFAIALFVVLATAGCSDHRISLAEFLELQKEASSPPATQPAKTQADINRLLDENLGPYKVGAADVLLVTLGGTGDVGLATQARITRKGQITLPLLNAPVNVAGLELEDVEMTIQQAYLPVYKTAVVHVELFSTEMTNVLVVGAVSLPGLVQLNRNQRNMFFAIVAAGGVSEAASGRATLCRIRRPAEAVTLELTDPIELRGVLTIDPLESGDIITVHAATPNTVYVGGLVNAPRPQPYPPGVEPTILQVIAASGGLRTDVTPKNATLIRRMPDGRDVHVKLDLDRLAIGKDQNICLAAGDILWVPETFQTKVQDWVNRNVFFRIGASATVSYDVSGVEFMNRRRFQTGGATARRSLSDRFDPFGELLRNSALQSIGASIPVP